MNKFNKLSLHITSCILAVLAIGISIRFIDQALALRIWAFTSSHPSLHQLFENIPNTLPKVVAICTATFWLAYSVIIRQKGPSHQAQFLQLAALAVPLAFLIKIPLHQAFGRTHIRLWLRIGGPLEFNWFKPLEMNGGFPSGHAVVCSAFLTAVWLYYPRHRPLSVAVFSTLALALLLTSYHFLSDIIAGMCCGILITLSIYLFLSKIRAPKS